MPHGQNSTRAPGFTDLCGLVNGAEEIRESFDRVLRLRVMVSRVVAGRHSVHVLAIELQPIESPINQNFPHQCLVVFHDIAVRWTQIVRSSTRRLFSWSHHGSVTRSRDDREAVSSPARRSSVTTKVAL